LFIYRKSNELYIYGDVVAMQKTIEVVYEKGVFKPLEPVEMEEGTKLKIPLKEDVLKKYYRAIPIRISKEDIEQFRLEMLDR